MLVFDSVGEVVAVNFTFYIHMSIYTSTRLCYSFYSIPLVIFVVLLHCLYAICFLLVVFLINFSPSFCKGIRSDEVYSLCVLQSLMGGGTSFSSGGPGKVCLLYCMFLWALVG